MENPHYAGFWIRLVADLIDSFILLVVNFLIYYFLFGLTYMVLYFFRGADSVAGFTEEVAPLWLQMLGGGLYLLLAIPYFIWGHYRWGMTLGKKPFNIRVVDEKTLGRLSLRQSAIRFFGYAPSWAVMGAGFLMAAFHPKKRALHDLLAGTACIRMPHHQKKQAS